MALGLAALLVAVDPVAKPATSFSRTHAAASRCGWQIDPYKVRGELDGLTAINRNDVWAVGGADTDDSRPLALHWLGQGWRRVAVPMRQDPSSLNAADFATPNDGWAVGGEAAHWDGRRWTIVPTPGLSFYLEDVAALRKDDAWAVGSSGDGVHAYAAAGHWNGRRWVDMATPDVGQSLLRAVAVISRNNVWAVGNKTDRTLIEHWDGKHWRKVPNPAAPRGEFADIAAVSARDIWAVGDYGPPGANEVRPLIEHWDGTKWSVVSSPVRRASLKSVAALSTRDIWVSGGRETATYGAILAHRLGATWRLVQTPHIKGHRSLLIAAAGRDDIWAVGHVIYYSYHDVIEHYSCRT